MRCLCESFDLHCVGQDTKTYQGRRHEKTSLVPSIEPKRALVIRSNVASEHRRSGMPKQTQPPPHARADAASGSGRRSDSRQTRANQRSQACAIARSPLKAEPLFEPRARTRFSIQAERRRSWRAPRRKRDLQNISKALTERDECRGAGTSRNILGQPRARARSRRSDRSHTGANRSSKNLKN